jgi:hypothetical protein
MRTTALGHLRKLASDCFLEDIRAHLSHRGIRSRLAEVNLKPTEASKAALNKSHQSSGLSR